MGLGTPKKSRDLYEDELCRESAAARKAEGATPSAPDGSPASISLLIYDAITYVRSKSPTKRPVTIRSLAERLFLHATTIVPPGTEIRIFFDTQSNMPSQRDAVAERRSPRATEQEIAAARADPSDRRVLVNGRLFKPEEKPLTDEEIEAVDPETEFMLVRAMNSRRGKEMVWNSIEEELARFFASDLRAGGCHVLIDGCRTGPDAVTRIRRDGGAGEAASVVVTTEPRPIAFGESDQKAAYAATLADRPEGPGSAVIVTIDTDMIAQLLCLGQRRRFRDTYIGFLPHASSQSKEMRWIDTFGFPSDGSGTSIALLLSLHGTDYTPSIVGCGLSPDKAIERGLDRLPPCFTFDSGAGTVHTDAIVQTLRHAATGKKPRDVFSFSGDRFFVSKASATAAAAQEGLAGPVKKRPRLLEDMHSDLEPMAWLLAYWGLVGTERTPAAPLAAGPPRRLFDCTAPVTRFLQQGAAVSGVSNVIFE